MDEPGPAGAELADAGVLELLLEGVEGAERLVDRVGEVAVGLAAAVRAHRSPRRGCGWSGRRRCCGPRSACRRAGCRGSGGPPRRPCRPTRCPRARRWPCRRRPGGACRGGPASSPRRCAARARRSRREDRELRKPFGSPWSIRRLPESIPVVLCSIRRRLALPWPAPLLGCAPGCPTLRPRSSGRLRASGSSGPRSRPLPASTGFPRTTTSSGAGRSRTSSASGR